MKMPELKKLTKEELENKLNDLVEELFNLEFQLKINQLENFMRIKAVEKDIVRIKTLLTELSGQEIAS